MDIHNDHHATKPEPFPIMATISVGIAMFANNIAMSNLFSYVGFMVVHLKVVQTKEESGFYAGFLASSLVIGSLNNSFLFIASSVNPLYILSFFFTAPEDFKITSSSRQYLGELAALFPNHQNKRHVWINIPYEK